MSHHGNTPPDFLRKPSPLIEELRRKQEELCERLGATGQFPGGKLDDNDEGEIRFAIAGDQEHQLVHIDFGKLVSYVSMTPQQAVDVATSLIKQARGASRTPLAVTLH